MSTSYSISEVAKACQVLPSFIETEIKEGRLNAEKDNEGHQIREEQVQDWLEGKEFPRVIIPFPKTPDS